MPRGVSLQERAVAIIIRQLFAFLRLLMGQFGTGHGPGLSRAVPDSMCLL